jgi:hypothetical protein
MSNFDLIQVPGSKIFTFFKTCCILKVVGIFLNYMYIAKKHVEEIVHYR